MIAPREELVNRHRRALAVGLVLAGCAVSGDAAAQGGRAVREKMIGAWRLESRTVHTAGGGTVRDPVLGAQPSGRLFYDASGNMMLQMMRQDRAQAISIPANAADANNPRVVLGYDSYFGTFRVNEAAGTVTHHVEGSLFPEDLGKDWERQLTVDGDRLTLGFTSKTPEGDVVRTLVFRRFR
jgi:Lipocalin-like domain